MKRNPREKNAIPTANKWEVDARDRLILALDLPIIKCRELVNELGDLVRIVKINYLHFLEISNSSEPKVKEFLSFLKEKNVNVFFDLKFDDIKNTVSAYIRALSRVDNISFCTIHGNPSLMDAAIEGRSGGDKPKILAVTLLTSIDENNVDDSQPVVDYVLRRARQADERKLDGVIASGKHAGLIKKETNNGLAIVSPGIRLNECHDDHKRVTTPEEAIRNGSDYLVVGRPIYNAEKPRRVTEDIIDRMQKAFR